MNAAVQAVEAVLFDHDGTLVDSEPVHLLLWQQVLAPLGVALDVETYKAHHAGFPTVANAQDLVERFGLHIAADELAATKHAATEAWLAAQPFPLMPQAVAVISRLRDAGLRLAVVTGSETAAVQRTLRGHALDDAFEFIVSADDVERSKPAPDPYLLALHRLGLPAAHCVALEDTATGLRAAADAGLRALAIPHGLSAQHDLRLAHLRVDDLHQAADWVLNPALHAAR